MVYTSQYLEISTFEMKTVVYWKNQTINTFKASESNVIRIIGRTIIIAIIMKTVVFIWSNLTSRELIVIKQVVRILIQVKISQGWRWAYFH